MQDPKYLEDLTGLTALHQAATLMGNIDLDSDREQADEKDGEEDEDWTAL